MMNHLCQKFLVPSSKLDERIGDFVVESNLEVNWLEIICSIC